VILKNAATAIEDSAGKRDACGPVAHYGRIREMEAGPDGYIYFSTSNRDGRGSPAPDDDRIMRIIPN